MAWAPTSRRAIARLLVGVMLLTTLAYAFPPFTGAIARAETTRDAYTATPAGTADQLQGSHIAPNAGNGLSNIREDNWALYEDVDFGASGAVDVGFRAAVPYANAGNTIEVRLGAADGELVARHHLVGTATGYSNAQWQYVALSETVTGVHDVYVVFVLDPLSEGTGFCNLAEWQFGASYRTDTTAPVTTDYLSGTYDGSQYTSAVTVTLAARDDYRGVAQTVYSVDDGATWQSYTAPLVYDVEGEYNLQYYSTDAASNAETARTVSFTIADLGTRSAYATLQAETASELSGNNIRATETAVIGINTGNWMKFEAVNFGDEGALDVAMHVAVPNVAEGNRIEVRLGAPDGELVGALRLRGTAENYTNAATQRTALLRTVTGVHDVYLVFAVGPYSTSAQYCNIDWLVFGDAYAADTTAPTTTARLSGTLTGSDYTSAVTVTLDAYDDYRGVAQTQYSTDGGTTWLPYEGPVVVRREGSHTIQYYSIDLADNEEAVQTESFVISDLPDLAVFHMTNQMRPGEIAQIVGDYLDVVDAVRLFKLPDSAPTGEPAFVLRPKSHTTEGAGGSAYETTAVWSEADAVSAEIVGQTRQLVQWQVPDALDPGVYSVQLDVYGQPGRALYLNAPDITWIQGDDGKEATPGGWIRLTGRQLSEDGFTPTVVLEAVATGQLTTLPDVEAIDAYALDASLPSGLATGAYRVYVHNGRGGPSAWSEPSALQLNAPDVWPDTVFDVKAYGAKGDGVANDSAAVLDALAAIEAAGGGELYFPRGRYHLTVPIELPVYTTMRGESQQLTEVFWSPFEWDYNDLPEAVIEGSHHFAIRDISLRASRAGHFVLGEEGTEDAGYVTIERARIFSDPYMGHVPFDLSVALQTEVEQFRANHGNSLDVVRLGGKQIRIIDSELTGPYRPFQLARAEGAVVRGNTFYHGGWYSFHGADEVIFEDNNIVPLSMWTTGGGFGKPLDFGSRHIYFARNSFSNINGNDREVMTNDGGSGAYTGAIAAVDGTTLTLPAGAASWQPGEWSRGGGVFILSGTGAGQMRQIVTHTADVITLDAPFTVEPDETSVLSITAINFDNLFVENTFYRTGALNLYGEGVNMVIDGNTFRQSQGIFAWARLVYGGNQQQWYTDIKNNVLADGNYSHWYGVEDNHSGPSTIKVTTQGNYTLTIGAMVRNNTLMENSALILNGGSTQQGMKGVVVSGNHFADTGTAITVLGGVNDIVLSDNTYDTTAQELEVDSSLLASGRVRELD
ncbi:carbohydrate-binding protein [Paenibacillus sp. IB182496]|uniref:Carbohydrate-binding protein n=1 Tax=Paenibacillus sabuli TaxID=2772509 RepID=A0A927BW61_9BACL|nr:carbohydrate-binding protein [Paenibacillus sabuli]MBD2847011.1 carbohydrate-binding protein [Paenibacillus sabuli]